MRNGAKSETRDSGVFSHRPTTNGICRPSIWRGVANKLPATDKPLDVKDTNR